MKFLVLAIVVAMTGIGVSRANSNDDIYRIYLYYDHGKLTFDRDVISKVVIAHGWESFSSGDFKAEIIDKDGEILHSVKFDPRLRGIMEDVGGFVLEQSKTALDLLYFPEGAMLKVYDPSDVLILEYDISYLSTCNQNSVCESFYGEDTSTCPLDCKDAVLGGVSGKADSDMLSWLWLVVTIVTTGGLIFVLWKLWRKHVGQQSLP
ncbi:MAG: hypothetical protein HYT62_03260 [Candidatus Yanofskybacteria bacterium]|nr:hypothetical protein [Candidatus Yanofskybacteria bacterium]